MKKKRIRKIHHQHRLKNTKTEKEIDSGQVSLFYDQQLREYTDKKNFYDYCVLRLKKIKEELSDIDNQIKEHRK